MHSIQEGGSKKQQAASLIKNLSWLKMGLNHGHLLVLISDGKIYSFFRIDFCILGYKGRYNLPHDIYLDKR